MYAAPDRDTAHRRLVTFYEWAATVDVAEVARLAKTIGAWQDEVLTFFETQASNAPGERQREDQVGPESRSRVQE
jgi:transposase